MSVFPAIVTLLFLAASSVQARSLPYSTVERIRSLSSEGWQSAYNFKIADANTLFEEANRIEPLYPRPYLGKAMIAFWRYIVSRHEDEKEEFLRFADKTIDAAEKYEDRYGEEADVKLCLATIYGYRSFVYGRSRSYLKGAWDGKKSYDYFCDALKLDPKLYDAYLGVGLFHYFVTFVPKTLQWVIGVMGIEGDAQRGIREIRLAAERGTYSKTEAQYYLAQFLPWHEGEFGESEKILTELHGKYPANSLITFTLSVWEMRNADMSSAKAQLGALLNSNEDDVAGIRSFASYKLGECSFRLSSFDEAKKNYINFLDQYRDHTYRATANFRVGLCYEFEGNRDSALAYYKKASESDGRFGDDAYAVRRSQIYLYSAVTRTDSMLFAAQNAQKCGMYDEAIRMYSSILQGPALSADLHAEATYGLGETYVDRRSYEAALPIFRQLTAINVGKELWLKPWSHYYCGLCLVKTGDKANAKKEFQSSLGFDEFDFKNWLEFRANRELEQLK